MKKFFKTSVITLLLASISLRQVFNKDNNVKVLLPTNGVLHKINLRFCTKF